MFLVSPVVIALAVIAIILVVVVASCIRIVNQTEKYVIARLGNFKKVWSGGPHMLLPIFDRVIQKVSLKETVKDFEPQPVITKDNVTIQIDTVLFFQVTDPKKYCYEVDNPIVAIEKLSSTTLRNIIGELELDATLTSRDYINSKMRQILDEVTDAWGIKVNRVEVKNIIPPKDIRDAMEKQMRAERERRESILIAEGEKTSQILRAEGQKTSQILKAQGEKEASILLAEGERESLMRRAEGEAQAILSVQKATAEAIELLKNAKADKSVLTLKAFEALQKVSDGQATKIIIPSELQNIANLTLTASEIFRESKTEPKKNS